MSDPWDFCRRTLPHVSRTFALTVPVLPPPLSDTVCIAYLLCRVADTIEDRQDLTPAVRDALYLELAALLQHDRPEQVFRALWPAGDEAELQQLMEGIGQVLAAYRSLPDPERGAVRDCVHEMIEGMRRSLGTPGHGILWVSSSLQELERYCHYVAGTVGIMLTRLFNRTLALSLDESQGQRFGLGLQLTNILKDQQADVARGTSFLPSAWLDERHVLLPARRAALVERTLSHLQIAQRYTLAVPPQADGVRLFCLWALWMAVATLREVGRARSPQPKIGRPEVARLVAHSKVQVRDDARLQASFDRLVEEARQAGRLLAPTL